VESRSAGQTRIDFFIFLYQKFAFAELHARRRNGRPV
jgi:hypothetical protein